MAELAARCTSLLFSRAGLVLRYLSDRCRNPRCSGINAGIEFSCEIRFEATVPQWEYICEIARNAVWNRDVIGAGAAAGRVATELIEPGIIYQDSELRSVEINNDR